MVPVSLPKETPLKGHRVCALCFVRECVCDWFSERSQPCRLDSMRRVGDGRGRTYIGGRFLRDLNPGGASAPETHSNKSVSLFTNHDHKIFSVHFQEIEFASVAHYSVSVYEQWREE